MDKSCIHQSRKIRHAGDRDCGDDACFDEGTAGCATGRLIVIHSIVI